MINHRIGIDFDNTIVCYDDVFHQAAVEKQLIPTTIPASKGVVRDYLRSIGCEKEWTELQGYVYGARMDLATPYPGALHFLEQCRLKQIPTLIISHKTLYPFLGPKYNLHQAAKVWLENQQITSLAFLELTLREKLERIRLQNCSVFIDDLPEVLSEPDFPPGVQKILFDPNRLYRKEENYLYATSWREIAQLLNV